MTLYDDLLAAGVDVLLDDRKERPGVMFADAELIGIPYRLTFSERGLDDGSIEFQARTDTEKQHIPLDQAVAFIRQTLDNQP